MKNITKYEDFKKLKLIKEEVTGASNQRSNIEGSINDPFINVKGNFAGADQTLIGSAVIRLFNFAKRKGYQSLMYTWLKPALRRTYMKGLMKYLMLNNLELPKPKIFFDIIKLNENEEETEEKYNVKFVKNEKDLDLPDIDSILYDRNNKKIEITGLFKFSDTLNLNIEGGVVKDKVDKVSITSDSSEKEKEEKDIKTYSYSELVNLVGDFDIDYKKISIYVFNTIRDNGILEKNIIDEIKKTLKLSNDFISEISKGLNEDKYENINDAENYLKLWKAYNKLSDYLLNMINDYVDNEDVTKTKEINKINDKEFKISNKPKVKAQSVIESLNENKIKSKLKGSKDYIEKVDHLSNKYPDISDEDFVKLLSNKRDDVSNVVLDYKPEIVKIQLAAQRFYSSDVDENTRVANINDKKLLNNWAKMVQSVKSEFTHVMNTDLVDPFVLIKSDKTDISKLSSGSNTPLSKTTEIINNINELKYHSVLQSSFKQKNQPDTLFLIKMTIKDFTGYFICKIYDVNLGNDKYQAINLLKYISNTDEFFKKEQKNYNDYVKNINHINNFIKSSSGAGKQQTYTSTLIIYDQQFKIKENRVMMVNIYNGNEGINDNTLYELHHFNSKNNESVTFSVDNIPNFNTKNIYQPVSVKIDKEPFFFVDDDLNKKYGISKNDYKYDTSTIFNYKNLKDKCVNFFTNIIKR